MYRGFVFIIVMFFYGCSGNRCCLKNFDDLKLSNNNISYRNLKLNPRIRKLFNHVNFQNDSIFVNEITLNEEIGLKHIYPEYESRLTSFDTEIDTIVINNNKFCIQDLLNPKKEKIIYPKVVEAKIVFDNEKRILVIEGIYEEDVEIRHLNWRIFFDITDIKYPKKIKSSLFNFISLIENSFDDFNCDGKVDYCFFDGEKLVFCNIINEELIQLEDIYLDIQRESVNAYSINLDKSKWFFKLKENITLKKALFKIKLKNSIY